MLLSLSFEDSVTVSALSLASLVLGKSWTVSSTESGVGSVRLEDFPSRLL